MRRPHVGRGEAGTGSLDLVIVAPLLIMFILLVIGFGRMALARQDVNAAAHEAARAASLQRVTGAAADTGTAAAHRTLADRGMSCAHLTVDVNTSTYRPGGQVTATVTCVADLSDLALAGLPGSKTYTAEAVVPIATWRADQQEQH